MFSIAQMLDIDGREEMVAMMHNAAVAFNPFPSFLKIYHPMEVVWNQNLSTIFEQILLNPSLAREK